MSIQKDVETVVRPPRKYAIAACSSGFIGLILSDGVEPILYEDGNQGMAWTGIHLTHATRKVRFGGTEHEKTVRPGDPWSSRTPLVLNYIEECDISIQPYQAIGVSPL
jgi:hypothetical protein